MLAYGTLDAHAWLYFLPVRSMWAKQQEAAHKQQEAADKQQEAAQGRCSLAGARGS